MRKSPKRFYPLDLCSHRRGPIHATLARALQSLGSPAAPTPLHCIQRRCAIQARIRRHSARSEYLPSPPDASSRSLIASLRLQAAPSPVRLVSLPRAICRLTRSLCSPARFARVLDVVWGGVFPLPNSVTCPL